jgi:Putative phage abortive infection protein
MTHFYLLAIPWMTFSWWLAIVVLAILFYRADRRNKRYYETGVGIILLVITMLFVGDIVARTVFPLKWPLEPILYGNDLVNLPNYLVFLGTAISAYFIYRTLNSQRRANQVAAFENRFFKFVDYHRANVQQMKYRDPSDLAGETVFRENRVFVIIYREMRKMFRDIKRIRRQHGLPITKEVERGIVDFVYQCVFYGATDDVAPVLRKSFSDDRRAYFSYINFWGRSAAYAPHGEVKYYGGHIRRLGHYFRNLIQAVRYVERQTFLTEKEKYEYVTILRAQMSLYEQAVFFYSSLSELGETWEQARYKSKLPKSRKARKAIFNNLLITKYDLLRNLFDSDGSLPEGLNVTNCYPLITMERREECTVHGVLPFKENARSICRFCFNERYIGYQNEDAIGKLEAEYSTHPEHFEGFSCSEHCRTLRFLRRNGWRPIEVDPQEGSPERPSSGRYKKP